MSEIDNKPLDHSQARDVWLAFDKQARPAGGECCRNAATHMDELQALVDQLNADIILLSATGHRLRRQLEASKVLIAGLERRAIAHGKELGELAAQAADVAGERAANALLTDGTTTMRAHLDDALFVLGMVEKNNRIDAGEKGKAWNGRFVVEEVRRVLSGRHMPEHQNFAQDASAALCRSPHEAMALVLSHEGRIERLRKALLVAVRQNEHDMLMTGDELRACRSALTGLGA